MNLLPSNFPYNFAYWENRALYIELIEKFLAEEINGIEFDREFCRMWRVDRDKEYSFAEYLKNVEDLKGFGSLISELFVDCDAFEPDSSLRGKDEISEEELKECVQQTLLKLKSRYT